MTISRTGAVAGLVLTSALALAACGSDNNTTGSGTPSSGGSSSSTSAAGTVGGVKCATGSLTAAGSTAQANAMDQWVKDYQTACSGATINYQGVGSSSGRQQFASKTIDFAGSDSSIPDAEQAGADARCTGGKAINIPMVVGPIGVAYNLDGVDDLVLDGPTIAKIFAGTITKWDDPAIKALNGSAKLPSSTIQTFHRSDGSGTTDNFTKYLAAAGGSAWTFASGSDWKAPGGQGAKGSDGVAAGVKGATGSIGYMELSFVENTGLKAAKIDNGSGSPVELSTANAGKAVEAAQVVGTGDDLKLSIDYATKAAGTYPIVLVTYEIACDKGNDPAKLDLMKSFLEYTSSEDGQKSISSLGYAPLPSSFVSKVRTSVTALS